MGAIAEAVGHFAAPAPISALAAPTTKRWAVKSLGVMEIVVAVAVAAAAAAEAFLEGWAVKSLGVMAIVVAVAAVAAAEAFLEAAVFLEAAAAEWTLHRGSLCAPALRKCDSSH